MFFNDGKWECNMNEKRNKHDICATAQKRSDLEKLSYWLSRHGDGLSPELRRLADRARLSLASMKQCAYPHSQALQDGAKADLAAFVAAFSRA